MAAAVRAGQRTARLSDWSRRPGAGCRQALCRRLPGPPPPGPPIGLDALPLLRQVGQQAVVVLVEQVARQRGQTGEDVTGRGRVLAALQPRAKLTCTADRS